MGRLISQNRDLHGNVPDSCPVALLLVDVINDLNFPENRALVKAADRLAKNIANLKFRCREAGIPAIYANDNRDKWRSDFSTVVEHCLRPEFIGRKMVEMLAPAPEDYVVLKPKHSAFYSTPLDTLLSYLQAKTVIVAGLTTSACILMTAGEIYVRDLRLYVPSDCVAGLNARGHRDALQLMKKSYNAKLTPAGKLNLKDVLRQARNPDS